jgi:hypothetical protein
MLTISGRERLARNMTAKLIMLPFTVKVFDDWAPAPLLSQPESRHDLVRYLFYIGKIQYQKIKRKGVHIDNR